MDFFVWQMSLQNFPMIDSSKYFQIFQVSLRCSDSQFLFDLFDKGPLNIINIINIFYSELGMKWQSTAEHSLCTEVVGGCKQDGRGFMGTGPLDAGRVIGTQQRQ